MHNIDNENVKEWFPQLIFVCCREFCIGKKSDLIGQTMGKGERVDQKSWSQSRDAAGIVFTTWKMNAITLTMQNFYMP